MKFPFIGAAYTSESLNLNAQSCINLYLEKDEDTGRPALLGTPGLTLWTTLGETPVRGLWAGEDRLFAAAGTKFYEIASNGTATERGTIADDATHSPVTILANGTTLLIVSAGHVYYDNGSGVFHAYFTDVGYDDLTIDASDNTKIGSAETAFAAGDLGRWLSITGGTGFTVGFVQIVAVNTVTGVATVSPAAGVVGSTGGLASIPVMGRTGAFLDNYAIVNYPDTRVFYFSGDEDGAPSFTQWNAGEFSVKESYPDNISSLLADHTELWVFGTHKSSEVWRNEGAEDAAGGFRRDPGAQMPFATVAPFSVCNLKGPAWLGGDTRGRIAAYRAQGFTPVRISTHAVEQEWQSYSSVSDAISFVQEDKGHTFWWISFPTGNATWVYDLSTGLWHQRSYWDGSAHDRHRARCHAFAFGKHLVGDWENGKIYEMSRSVYTDDGSTIRRVRAAQAISEELKRIFYSRIQFDMEVSTSKTPDVILDWSDDAGYNFNTSRTLEASLSSRKGRVIANRLGSGRNRVFRITITDAAKVAIQDAYLEALAAGH